MEEYAGRILAGRYRLPVPPSDEYELIETRAFDTRSGQEVLVRQVPLPEVVDAELLDGPRAVPAARRSPADLPAVRRAIEAAQAAASIPDHPRLDQVFDVFAEGDSLWIVSELVPARPLAALIADEPLSPYRAAEVASDVLTALRVLHAHGWTHRNITVRTVLVCEDGRVVLTGLAAGAAEEALCGYDPVPSAEDTGGGAGWGTAPVPAPAPTTAPVPTSAPDTVPVPVPTPRPAPDPFPDPTPAAAGPVEVTYAPLVAPGYDTGPRYTDHITPDRSQDRPELQAAARAGVVAAYRAGARAAAARVIEERRAGTAGEVESGGSSERRPEGSTLPHGYAYPYGGPDTEAAAPWHGATPRRAELPTGGPEPEPEREPEPRPDPEPLPPYPARRQYPDPDPDPGSYGYADPYPEPEQAQPERPALPARLALPQGYRQAEVPLQAGPDRPQPTGPGTGSGSGPGWSGPRTGLDAERARQTRMAVVGAVTERWAPEQAGPVHGHWQLAAPVGPATDLWALGALLYRAVQGHAPYPEDSVAELVEMVCAEPPAFAEECGALRPVVESLLRQDPTERPDFEELRGWLRSLVRSAPEPDAGFGTLPMPEPDPARLPVVRRRGEVHGRHRNPAAPRKPRALGRILLVGILALLAGGVAYAMLFLPRAADQEPAGDARGSTAQAPAKPSPSQVPSAAPESKPAPQATAPAESQAAPAPAPAGYTSQQDPEHFEIAVPNGWERRGINESGQVRYTDGQFVLTVVPGRDKVQGNPDPAAYQKDKEPELTPYRTSTWSTVGDVKTTKVGQQLRATGRYTWIDGTGRNVFARNYVVALGGSYHVVLVTGPEDEQSKVTEVFEKATASYKAGG
ncbi:protein kinase-like protein [Streptomyces sp. CG 926]|uniref:protein kinase n=1 Tax=Streptomyces sp. CG 926 TaxID=1882405 RepID=UPI000D6C5A10|nr:protein kinase [Streptomyces sp. CG 926]PWK62972.1 protein kinase-like protein [Streptomyces sp. CG 926]